MRFAPIVLFSLNPYQEREKVDKIAVWPDLAKFHRFSSIAQAFGELTKDYLVLDKMLAIFYTLGQIFVVFKDTMLHK